MSAVTQSEADGLLFQLAGMGGQAAFSPEEAGTVAVLQMRGLVQCDAENSAVFMTAEGHARINQLRIEASQPRRGWQ